MNARTFGFLALLAVAPFAIAQDFNQKITISGPPMTAKKLLLEVSRQAQYPFETSLQTANDVLMVRVKDVTLNDLLKKIAEATAAEWTKDEKGYRLGRSPMLQQNQAKVDIGARAQQIQTAMTKLFEPLDKKADFTRTDADALIKERTNPTNTREGLRPFGMSSEQNPSMRALLRLLKTVPAADLAALPASSRTVYSSYPTRMQVPFRGNVQQVLNQFVKEHNIFAEASGTVPETPPTRINGEGGRVFFEVPGQGVVKPFTGRIGKVLLVVLRSSTEPTFSIEMKIYDADGKLISQSHSFLSGAGIPMGGGTASANANEKPIALSNESKQFAKLFSPQSASGQPPAPRMMFSVRQNNQDIMIGGPGQDAAEVPADWREKLGNPDQFEPLSFVLGDLFGALADSKGGNFVAGLHDTLLIPAVRNAAMSTLTVSRLVKMLPSLGLKLDEKDGWVVISPAFPTEAIACRVDRAALGNLLRRALANGHSRLDDLATYATKQPAYIGPLAFDDQYISLLCPDASYQSFMGMSGDRRLMLRFYATLSMGQRQTLTGGQSLPIGRMAPHQVGLIRSMVFDSQMGPNINLPPPPGQNVQERSATVVRSAGAGGGAMFSFRSNEELMHERTEALPNGVPGDGSINLTVNSQEAVLASRSHGSGSQLYTAGDYGGYLAMRSSPNMSQFIGSQPEFDRFRLGTVTSYDFGFSLSQIASMGRSLRDVQLASAQTTSYDRLPAAFKQQVEAAKAQVAETVGRMQMMPGGGVRVGPPPGGGSGAPPPQ